MSFLDALRLPETRGIASLDDPAATALHRAIILKKPFLKRLYAEWYGVFRRAVRPPLESRMLVELGSGGGFIKDMMPHVVTSDVLDLQWIDRRFSALDMPFADQSVDAFFMINVLHHLPDTCRFLAELDRCLKQGGKAVMIEPANTPWSRFVYRNFHHEPFDPTAGWTFPAGGPLSSANDALPFIVFQRDRGEFQRKFPRLRIVRLDIHTPLAYLLSGGVSMRQLVPAWSFRTVRFLERLAGPANRLAGMFMTVELERGK